MYRTVSFAERKDFEAVAAKALVEMAFVLILLPSLGEEHTEIQSYYQNQ